MQTARFSIFVRKRFASIQSAATPLRSALIYQSSLRLIHQVSKRLMSQYKYADVRRLLDCMD